MNEEFTDTPVKIEDFNNLQTKVDSLSTILDTQINELKNTISNMKVEVNTYKTTVDNFKSYQLYIFIFCILCGLLGYLLGRIVKNKVK